MTPPLPPARAASWLRSLGLALTLLGIAVILGWLLHRIELTRLVPHLRSMVFNTALSFLLMGQALRQWPRASRKGQRGPAVLGTAVLLLAASNLLQLLANVPLGIDLVGLHSWADDGNPHPGRMSLPTTLCFLLAGSSLLLAQVGGGNAAQHKVSGQLLAAAVFALGGISLLGYALGLEALFGRYPLAGMALHTAIGMVLLAIGLWLGWQGQAGSAAMTPPSAERLLRLATWAPAVVALLAGITGILIFKSRADSALLEGLRSSQEVRISQIDTVLSLRGTRAAIVANRPGLDGDGAAIQKALEGFLPYGFSHIQLQLSDGRRAFSAGLASATGLELPLRLNGIAGKASLVWTGDTLLLRLRTELVDEGDSTRSLLGEQPLPILRQLLESSPVPDVGHLRLCGQLQTGIICLPDSTHAAPYVPAPAASGVLDPLQLAMAGQRGTGTFRDATGHLYTTVYAPVGSTGLVSSFWVDTEALNAGTRQQLLWGLLLVLLVTGTGTLLLRRNIQRQTGELLELKRKHEVVMDALQEGVMLLDSAGNILTANPACTRILGLARDEITGRSSMDPRWVAIHEDGNPCAAEDFPANRALRSGEGESGVIIGLRNPDGQVVWLSVNSSPTAGAGVVLSFEDITAQRAATLREREQEERFRMLVDSLRDYAIFMLDPAGRVSSWNSGAERLKGYTAEEIVGRHFSAFYPAEDVASGKPATELRIATDTGRYEEQGWRLRKDGSRFWAQVTVSAMRDDSGRLRGYAKVSRDLTAQRQVGLALAEANRLREAILDAAPFSIIATDPDGTIRAINPAGERMLWYPREELVGKATPALIHDGEEVRLRAAELSSELGETITPGFEVFVRKSRFGVVEEREWTYIRKDGSRFPVNLAVTALRDTAGEISGFLGIAYDITERKRREEYTQHVAHHDHLTGLPNRALLTDRLQLALLQAQRSRKPLALLMLDLDHFKRVNDTLGHHVGDELLVTVAKRLLTCVRGADTVARMGGDEFVVVLPEVSDVDAAERIARNILEAISQPVTIGSHELNVTPSIGISLYPRDGSDANTLLRNADTAMYRAKADGRRGISLFSAEMARAATEKLHLENALHRALRNGEFQLYYQPQVCLRSGRVLGVEALLRWPDPAGGMIPPDRFIPVAEESGLMLAIGEWVLRTACRQGCELQQRSGRPLQIAVNISPRQFRRPEFAAELAAVLHETGLDPRTLELEITEGLLMEQTEQSVAHLHEIRALGVGVAIDDFGVGYSSLSYITRFPISTLKIDRCFVSQLPDSSNDAAVAQTIIALAAGLQIRVVAEGVETLAQLEFLRRHHCGEAQGFYFGAAVTSAQFAVQGFHFSPGVPFEQFTAVAELLQPTTDTILQ